MIAARDKHRVACPAAARIMHNPGVLVPSPGLVYQDEPVAGVAKSKLKLSADGRGDSVIRDWRVTIVADPSNCLACLRPAEGIKEMIERVAGWVFNFPRCSGDLARDLGGNCRRSLA